MYVRASSETRRLSRVAQDLGEISVEWQRPDGGTRTELDVQVDLWADVMWVPHSRWIIPLGDTFTPNRSAGMLAVNTETAEQKYIDGQGLLLGLDVIVAITDEGHR